MDTASPVSALTRSMKARLPSTPPQNVSDDMPITRWSGSQVITSRMAIRIELRISARSVSKSASEPSAGLATYMRPAWHVTPGGASRAKSASTTVLVDGTMTPSFARYPVTSGTAPARRRRRGQAKARSSAWERSAIRSSASSMPTE